MDNKASALNTFVTIISVIVSVTILLLPAVATYFKIENPNLLSFIVIGAVILFSLAFGYVRYYRNVKGSFPFANDFWSIITNILPENPKKYVNKFQTNIATVFNNQSADLVQSFIGKFKDEGFVKFAEYDFNELSSEELKTVFAKTDGILVFYNDSLKDAENEKLFEEFNKLAIKFSHVPVVVVNLISNGYYDLQFDHIGEDKLSEGVWRLLVRAKERGKLWKNQSSKLWRIGIISVFGLITSSLIYFSIIAKKNRIQRDHITLKANNIRELSLSIKPVRMLLDSAILKTEDATVTLQGLLDYSLKDLILTQGGTELNYKLTYWRSIEKNNKKYVFECLWTNYHEQKVFELDNNSIAGCAFNNEDNIIVWKSSEDTDEKITAWDWKRRRKSGSYFLPNKSLVLNGDECFFKSLIDYDDFDFTGIVCYSSNIPNSNKKSGLCMYALDGNDLIDTEWTYNRLVYINTVFQLFPDSFFEIPDLNKEVIITN